MIGLVIGISLKSCTLHKKKDKNLKELLQKCLSFSVYIKKGVGEIVQSKKNMGGGGWLVILLFVPWLKIDKTYNKLYIKEER